MKRFKKKKTGQSNFAKLSIFSPQKFRFKKKCPLSGKGAPTIDYKNIRLLKKYISENLVFISWSYNEFYFSNYCFFFIYIFRWIY